MQLPAPNNSSKEQAEQLWNLVLEQVQALIGKPSFETWFAPIIPESLFDGTLLLSTPNEFSRDWITSRYSTVISIALKKIGRDDITYMFKNNYNDSKWEKEVPLPKTLTSASPVARQVILDRIEELESRFQKEIHLLQNMLLHPHLPRRRRQTLA